MNRNTWAKGSLCLEKNKIYQLPLDENNRGKLIKKFKLNQLGTYDDIWKNFGLTLKKKTKNLCSGDKVINTEKTIRFMYESANKEKVIYFK